MSILISSDAADPGRLRPMEERDLPAALAWRNHVSVRSFMLTTHEIAPDEHRAWFARCVQDPGRRLLIFERGEAALGFMQFTRLSADPEVADWGFYAAPEAPRGTGRALGRAALEFGFEKFGLRRICGQAFEHNAASIRFHEALGFRPEGRLRAHHRDAEGHLRDLLLFGLLKTDQRASEEHP